MDSTDALRTQLIKLLDWEDAHATYDAAVAGIPPSHYGLVPHDLPYSLWQLLEHIRIAQHDILDFCVNPEYKELDWPDEFWPRSSAPPSPEAWEESVERYRRDREALKQLAADPEIDLFAAIPHGEGQMYLREILLAADHTTYHVGQLLVVRRLLGIWQ